MRIIILTICLCCALMGCRTTATQYKRIDDKMVEVERLELKGLGNREVTFSDKAKLECDTGFRVPDLKVDIDDFKTD